MQQCKKVKSLSITEQIHVKLNMTESGHLNIM